MATRATTFLVRTATTTLRRPNNRTLHTTPTRFLPTILDQQRQRRMWFWSSSSMAERLQPMRDAETSLLSFVDRFHHNRGLHQQIELEVKVQDTLIPKSAVPVKGDGVCFFAQDDDHDEENYVVHGVHIKSKQQDCHQSSQHLSETTPLVLLHGYMNGSSYFYRNFAGLSRYFSSIHSLDLLGWGLSSRPSLPFDSSSSVAETEDVFCESLEAWRKENKIDKMILAGHSMGGTYNNVYIARFGGLLHAETTNSWAFFYLSFFPSCKRIH